MRRTTAVLAIGAAVALASTTSAAAAPVPEGAAGYDSYVSLGDSFTSGPALPPVVNGLCGRSGANYPHLLADDLGAELTDMSCGGATTANIDQGPQGANPVQVAGIGPETKLVTLSIGGNDEMLYARLMMRCRMVAARPHFLSNPCQAALGWQIPGMLERTQAKVLRNIAAIHAKAPVAKVVLVGYPRIGGTEGTCAALPVAPGDVPWMAQVEDGLSGAMEKAAEQDGNATFVDMHEPSTDHHACSADPWVNGVVAGSDGAIGHPNANGMRATADAIRAALGA
ncbi:SGNH/GDSL hydrolase family protein [Pseudonocardia sp. TRM90224]|uniref:SGNH/GDSL hydrolase family protein n=1 Tax=Pseudonocardia sp. TRM90224 TaxID=2812678 RepID=UPI001E492AED|nr:SGNH/GDSL hydrolase family protein [Pseudonocardia sp. TRM90224]